MPAPSPTHPPQDRAELLASVERESQESLAAGSQAEQDATERLLGAMDRRGADLEAQICRGADDLHSLKIK